VLMRHFLDRAAIELGVEAKTLSEDTLERLRQLDWPGNVRQLENTARWLTVMASGQEIHPEDLPPELVQSGDREVEGGDWRTALRSWARASLHQGQSGLLDQAMPAFETIMIETALAHTGGRRQDAARLLGWGRNTLTRKIKELGLETESSDEA
jgi:two-component system nitrogen regulation response regulator GlnG